MNSRQSTILTHIASWAALLFVPMMFMGHGEGITPRHVLMSIGVTLSFIAVFYPNFIWITPHYYTAGERRYFVLLNLIIIVAVAVAFHFWMDMCNLLFPSPKHHHDGQEHTYLLFMLRDMFNLAIVAAVATALRLASLWHENEDARHQAEVARSEAELKTLRNQINPHFLLNTLNNIYALTAIDAERAQEAIQQLSRILRHLLYDYEQPMVPLHDEVEFLENYVHLMRIRLPQSVEVSSQFSILNPQMPIAPMLFISLVENAFKHGISPTSPSFIRMQLNADEQYIDFCIENSNHPKTEQDRSGHGIGLSQVQRRLDLSYPDRYTWQRGPSADDTVYYSQIKIKVTSEK